MITFNYTEKKKKGKDQVFEKDFYQHEVKQNGFPNNFLLIIKFN